MFITLCGRKWVKMLHQKRKNISRKLNEGSEQRGSTHFLKTMYCKIFRKLKVKLQQHRVVPEIQKMWLTQFVKVVDKAIYNSIFDTKVFESLASHFLFTKAVEWRTKIATSFLSTNWTGLLQVCLQLPNTDRLVANLSNSDSKS